MTSLRRLALCAACFAAVTLSVFASKSTDVMSEALKLRSKGQYSEAIKSLKTAVSQAGSALQKNLALALLGDCQLMAGKHKDAAATFLTLSKSAKNAEDKAEALYSLMQAQYGMGSSKQAKKTFAEIKKNYKKTPYYSLAESFIAAEGLKTDLNSEITDEEINKTNAVKPKTKAQSAKAKAAPEANLKADAKASAKGKAKANTGARAKAGAGASATAKANAAAEISAKVSANAGVKTEKASEANAKKASAGKKAAVKKTKTQLYSESAFKPQNGKGAIKTAPPRAESKSLAQKASAETAKLLQIDLALNKPSEAEKNALVTKILRLQNELKTAPKAEQDNVLYELAKNTADFGELLEACKLYDRILREYPSSKHVERAYFEAIRLRAALKVYEAVVSWAKAFLAAFPSSAYKRRVVALVEYAKAKGNLDLSAYKGSAAQPQKITQSGVKNANKTLEADSTYKAAMQRMKDGKYQIALSMLKKLEGKYSNAPLLWWNQALIEVQTESFKNAERAVKKMLLLDCENEDANSLLGYIHYRLENYKEAADAYNQAGQTGSGSGQGINFFDTETASKRMQKSAENKNFKEN